MVSNISLNNINNNPAIQQNIAFKGANKTTSPVKQEQKDSFASTVASSAGFVGLMHGLPLIKFLKNTKIINGSIKPNAMVEQIAKNNVAAKKALLSGEGSFIKRFGKYAIQAEKTTDALSYVKSATKAEAKAIKLADKAKKLAENGKKSAKVIAKAEAKSAEAAAKALNKANDAQEMISKINQFGKVATKSGSKIGKFAKAKNFMKSSGLGIQLAFSGMSELFFEVVPTFKELGAEKGFKQLGKSAVKVLGDVVGYAGGQAIGAAIGTVLFSGIPVVGPFLGAALGFGVGMIGSTLAGKVTDKITGPSERTIAEKAKEAEMANTNPFNNEKEVTLEGTEALGYATEFAQKELTPGTLRSTTA